ncbi:chemotaxis protein CheD [Clostridium boliviensis]|uniref:Probable chemoreceptor glutamine deamidase CheD n=1 Tax=Clostridium boliviensis TaxID=318465 RepID=A0ABU4GKJ3_9CLOT|nr:chemotaxis protein CheD [Clostridium boliviensis]MDW2798124.1 chemotaxis protein CheD [Clostridium boliviensis]
MDKQITVGIADMKFARQEGTLITYALGSCIGISLYDPMIKLGALVHIMLPEVYGTADVNVFKYADTGLAETFRKIEILGARKPRLIAKIAGGAKMFELQGNSTLGNIGARNIVSVKQILQKEGIRLAALDVGENYARTMSVDVSTGQVKIRTYGRAEIVL